MARAYSEAFVLVTLIASTVFPMLVRAVDYVPGVRVGDWVRYGQFSVSWTGNGTEPSSVTEEKKIDWAKIEVISVNGTTVTLNTTAHYNNGTQITRSGTEDVSGQSSSMGGLFLIAANLKSGDPLTTQSSSVKINQTTTRTYASISRNVNVVNVTTVNQDQTTVTTFYYDQSTGCMVEIYLKQPDNSNPGAYTEFSVIATETNMWSPDLLGTLSDNLIYIIAGTIAIIAVIAAAIALRRKKPPVPPPPPPAQTTQTPLPN